MAVIDSGLNVHDPRFSDVLCPTGHKDFTGKRDLTDRDGHGTHVVGIIAKAARDHSKYCLVIYKTIGGGVENYLKALEAVQKEHIELVNISLSGEDFDQEEKGLLASSGATYVVAAGNENKPYTTAYPGGYDLPNVLVIGNWDCQNKRREESSNYGKKVIWRCGTNIKSTLPKGKEGVKTGTSMAAPLYTAEMIERMTNGKK